jgi:hypothetical protein
MPKLMSGAYPSGVGSATFLPQQWLVDTRSSLLIQGDEGKRLVKVAEKILRDYREASLRSIAFMQSRLISPNYNGDLEADLDEPQTLESLAARHKRFLATNQQNWTDVDLPSRLK